MLYVVFLTTPSNASRTLQSRFSNVRISLFQTRGKDYNIFPHFILLTVWKITTMEESNEFPLTPHYLVGIENSQPASSIFLSMVFAGFRTIPAMNVVKDPNNLIFLLQRFIYLQVLYQFKHLMHLSLKHLLKRV